MQFEGYRNEGKLKQALATGRRALLVYPDNLTVQVQLAELLAQTGNLSEARQRAERVLKTLETFRRPQQTTRQLWLAVKQNLRSDAHAVLGMIAYHEGQLKTAVGEFETAVGARQPPDPAQHLRLGRLYRELGRVSEAREQFSIVLKISEQAELRTLARQALEDMLTR